MQLLTIFIHLSLFHIEIVQKSYHFNYKQNIFISDKTIPEAVQCYHNKRNIHLQISSFITSEARLQWSFMIILHNLHYSYTVHSFESSNLQHHTKFSCVIKQLGYFKVRLQRWQNKPHIVVCQIKYQCLCAYKDKKTRLALFIIMYWRLNDSTLYK